MLGGKLVFIGKNLDKTELTEAFKACLETPEKVEERIRQLRFKVWDKVKCRTGVGVDENSWSVGEVVVLMYRDEYMPLGQVAPYQVKLDNGDLIFAPEDDEWVIRKA